MQRFTAMTLGGAAALLLAACGGSNTTTTVRRAATTDPARCVPAAIHDGAPPRWTDRAWADSSPGFRVPYALASGNAAAAFFFANLRAGHPRNPSNKILWVVRFPRDGHPLEVTARRGSDPSLIVRTSWPADSDPGEIYPSGIDLPTPGCWHVTLAWGTHRAKLDVEVRPPGRH